MLEIAEANIPARQSDAAFVGHELDAKRSPNGVLETLLQKQEVGGAKAIILVTPERHCAVDVSSSERLLIVERHMGG